MCCGKRVILIRFKSILLVITIFILSILVTISRNVKAGGWSWAGYSRTSPIPVRIPNLSNVSAIATGAEFTCALLRDGSVKCWGSNAYFQLGYGGYDPQYIPTPVAGINNAIAIATGAFHACAVLKDGTVKCWGEGDECQLGYGGKNDQISPVTVAGINNAISVTVGGAHSCALLNDGTVKCWGNNNYGQLGDGTEIDKCIPVDVLNLTDVIKVSAGGSHTCALLKNGTIKCWGNNAEGQLGDGTTENRNIPVTVLNVTDAIDIEAHGGSTCVLLKEGTVKCWGNKMLTISGITLDPISSLSNVASISKGDWHICALLKDGTVKCWGNNNNGQLGDGTKTDRASPVSVIGINNAIAISAGDWHTCALLKDGSVKCWGRIRLECGGDEIFNEERKDCIKKGIGCYSDTECYHFYSNSSVICYGSVHNHVNIPGHCCLKNEIWNGTACIERKLRIVVIPYKESWSQIGISDNDIKEIISSAFSYYPIRKEKVEVIIWKNPCNPPVDYLLWRFCPLFVGAAGYGDRYVIVTSKNEDLSSECGSDSMGGCAILNGETVIIREFTPTVVAHEIGHTFGLRDEYCQYKHPIFGWLCGTEAYPNPLKEEYGCRVFPLPRCEKAMLEAEKQTASPGEWIKVNIKDLQGSACEVYKAKIEVLKNGDWQLLSTCSPGEPCYVSFSENEKGTNKIRAKLVYTGYPFISSEIITNEVEINVQGSTTKSKIFGYSCDDNKLLLSLNVPFGTYWEIYGNGKEIWFRVEKNSNFSYELNGKFEIYDIACNKIGEGKMNVEKNGIYNIKVYGPLTSTSLPPRIEKLGFCCWDANVYDATCLGNTAISGGGRSIMASLITPRTHFSKPAWEHLKKVMEIWE